MTVKPVRAMTGKHVHKCACGADCDWCACECHLEQGDSPCSVQDGGSTCEWVMLNPSTADASVDDATIRKCVAFAKLWGHSAIEVVNLYAWRATDPRDLPVNSIAVGPDNDQHLLNAVHGCHAFVCAWGRNGALPRADYVLSLLRIFRGAPAAQCLGTNKNGTPKHPLYLPLKTPLVPMDGARCAS